MELKELGEFGLLKKLSGQFKSTHPRVIKGIGDDTSVTVQDETKYLLCTTDTLVEDIHFSLKHTSSYNLGKKAVSISLSDIAAMGGAPTFLLTSIILPASTPVDFINLLYKGIKERADEFAVALVGGNTSASPEKIVITTIMLGEVPKDQVIFRKGASAGDVVYVTGRLGDSSLGLKIWKEKDDKIITDPFLKDAMLAHIDPFPRVREGRKLAEKKLATSMIDISDGLISELRHITEESMVGAKIWLDKIPISTALKRWLVDHPADITLSLSGGEDYELLFTAPKANTPMIENLAKELGIPITQIGEIVPQEYGISVLDDKGGVFQPPSNGFEHWKSSAAK
ncbi:MAG: thiamine-phosphate kinase [Deltaproteobacteria bacterium]